MMDNDNNNENKTNKSDGIEKKKTNLTRPPRFGSSPESRLIQFMTMSSFNSPDLDKEDVSSLPENGPANNKLNTTNTPPVFGKTIPVVEKYNIVSDEKNTEDDGRDDE